MRQHDKPEEQPAECEQALGPPVNRPPPPAPVKRKVTDNVSEVSGRMFTEIARNVGAPPEPAKPPASTAGDEDREICCTAVGWMVNQLKRKS